MALIASGCVSFSTHAIEHAEEAIIGPVSSIAWRTIGNAQTLLALTLDLPVPAAAADCIDKLECVYKTKDLAR